MNTTAFGKVIGVCDNCRRLLYEGTSTIYYVKFQYDSYSFCDHCVTVVRPEKEKRDAGQDESQ